jgi:hypothetical protein
LAEGAYVRDVAKAVEAFSLLRDGGSLALYALDLEKPLGAVSFTLSAPGPPPAFEKLVLDAAEVCNKYKVDLRIPKKILKDDARTIAALLAVANGTPLPVSGFEAKVVKTKEFEGNFNAGTIGQTLQIIAHHEGLEPRPVVFGVPVDTGPVTAFARGAQIKGPEFLQRVRASAVRRSRKDRLQRLGHPSPTRGECGPRGIFVRSDHAEDGGPVVADSPDSGAPFPNGEV